jgi:uncharacterized membrane protein
LPIATCIFGEKIYNLFDMQTNRTWGDALRSALPLTGKGLLFIAVGLLLVGWLVNTPAGLLGKADAVGYAVCHRIDVRSFHLGERQLPLCARCTGMYLGAMLGLVAQVVASKRRAGMPPWQVLGFLGALVLAFGIDGVNSYLHLFPGAPSLYEPSNLLRLLTGTGMGLVIILVLYPAFNQAVWREVDPTPAVSGLRFFFAIAGLALALDWLVWIDNALLLYIFALVSAAGVLVLLTMVYSLFWLLILKKDNTCLWFSQMAMPLVAGFGIALLQIALFDLARFALTGTWDGFHLG